MAHGKLGSSRAGEDTVKTAAIKANSTAGEEELIATVEATEDRYIRGVMIQAQIDSGETGFVEVELSHSAEPTLTTGGTTVDATGSGVIAYHYSYGDSTNGWAHAAENYVTLDVDDEVAGGIEWEEEEELNVHARNDVSTNQAVRLIIYYERASDC